MKKDVEKKTFEKKKLKEFHFPQFSVTILAENKEEAIKKLKKK